MPLQDRISIAIDVNDEVNDFDEARMKEFSWELIGATDGSLSL